MEELAKILKFAPAIGVLCVMLVAVTALLGKERDRVVSTFKSASIVLILTLLIGAAGFYFEHEANEVKAREQTVMSSSYIVVVKKDIVTRGLIGATTNYYLTLEGDEERTTIQVTAGIYERYKIGDEYQHDGDQQDYSMTVSEKDTGQEQ